MSANMALTQAYEMTMVYHMANKYLSTLTSSFVCVIMAVSGIMLYFTWNDEMWVSVRSCLLLLACGFLYWAIWFWDKLSLHLSRKKDKRWQRAELERKQILKELNENR